MSLKSVLLALSLPLVLLGCSSTGGLYSGNAHGQGSAGQKVAQGAETSGAGEYASIDGQDVALSGQEPGQEGLNEVVFYFDFDKSDLNDSAYDALAKHAEYLSKHPNVKLRLEGHTDEKGSREYNVALGERRAQSIARILMLDGADKSQLALVSYGEEKPAVQGHDEGAWKFNRRAVLVYEVS